MLALMAVRNLTRNIRRTILITFTVALGCGALFAFDGFNNGILNQYRENTIHAHYGYGQIYEKGYREQVYEKPWEHWLSNWSELEAFLDTLPGVEHTFPRVSFFSLLTNGNVTVSGVGHGVHGAAESEFFHQLNFVEGEALKNQEDGIVLGRGLARALMVKPGDVVTLLGNTIHGSINGVDLVVTGIFHTGSKEFDDRVFRMQLPQAHALLDTQRIESVTLGLDKLSSWKKVAKKVETRFPELEAIPFAVLDKVYYQHSVDWLKSQFRVIQLIILTIVILGTLNTVSTGVLERRQEIGNLRANGESVRDVLSLLLTEGIVLGIVGAAAGIFLATLLQMTVLSQGILMPPAPGLTRQFHVMLELRPTMGMQAMALGMITVFVATFMAGWRVTRMPIGELLRST